MSIKSIVKNIIGDKKAHELVRLRAGLKFGFSFKAPRLANIGRFYETDKADFNHTFGGLSYLDIYEKYLADFRKKDISLLEIGVREGASLRTWESYFKNGKIFGIDIDPICKSTEEGRIQVEIGSQDDVEFIKHCFGESTKFDIIIDDGSHINSFTLTSFEHLFDRLNPGGLYIIEDLRCSYEELQDLHNMLEVWPGMKYNDPKKCYLNYRKDMDRFFLSKIKDIDHARGDILFVHFWSMICVIRKI